MLTGKALGKAIEIAINKKLDSGKAKSKAEIARYFHVKGPSIQGWIRTGAISKDRLPEIWNYFSDVVDLEHWGLTEADAHLITASLLKNSSTDCISTDFWPFKKARLIDFLKLSTSQQNQLDQMVAWHIEGALKVGKKNTTS